jgi:hypothetical protein
MNDPLSISGGIGQGEAQAFKPYDSTVKGLSKLKKPAAGKLPKLDDLDKIDIFSRDQPYFAEKSAEIRQFVIDNSEALMAGSDAKIMMAFQALKSKYFLGASNSKNTRENYETHGVKIHGKIDDFTDASISYMSEFATDKYMMQDFDPTQLGLKPEATDWMRNFTKDVSPTSFLTVNEEGDVTEESLRESKESNRVQAEQHLDTSLDGPIILEHFKGDREAAIEYLAENLKARQDKKNKRTLDEPPSQYGSGVTEEMAMTRKEKIYLIQNGDTTAVESLRGGMWAGNVITDVSWRETTEGAILEITAVDDTGKKFKYNVNAGNPESFHQINDAIEGKRNEKKINPDAMAKIKDAEEREFESVKTKVDNIIKLTKDQNPAALEMWKGKTVNSKEVEKVTVEKSEDGKKETIVWHGVDGRPIKKIIGTEENNWGYTEFLKLMEDNNIFRRTAKEKESKSSTKGKSGDSAASRKKYGY